MSATTVLSITCPTCSASFDAYCTTRSGARAHSLHPARVELHKRAAAARDLTDREADTEALMPRRAPRRGVSRTEARADLVARRDAQAAADVAAAAKAVADDDTKKSRVIASSHDGCSHAKTKVARAACRRTRKAAAK